MAIPTTHTAVVDLGSNTFHLLIVSQSGQEVYRERVFVSLAEEGIARIGDAAYQRGLDTMRYFADIMADRAVGPHRVVGTAALRSASNAETFISDVKAQTGLDIEVISGVEEARYISQGIRSVVPMEVGSYLIMDIGGGSVEFIWVLDGEVKLIRSLNIGIGQLYSKLSHSHPLQPSEAETIKAYIRTAMADILPTLAKADIQALVGASGSFEVLESLYGLEPKPHGHQTLECEQFFKVAEQVYQSTYQEIVDHPAIPAKRAQLIVLAFLLIEVTLEATASPLIKISPAAMKEGILADLLQ